MSNGRIGVALSAIDEDEWSWSVEQLRPGEIVWGSGSKVLASGCAWNEQDAVTKIKNELKKLGLTLADVTRLPF